MTTTFNYKNNNIQLDLDQSKFESAFQMYISICRNTGWLREAEAYKFKFARWLYERVDFSEQTDEEILKICLASQEQEFDSGDKGVNFIKTALRFTDKFISLEDIQLLRRMYEARGILEEFEIPWGHMTFPKFSAWAATLFPDIYMPYGKEETNKTIPYLFDLNKYPKSGIQAFKFLNICMNRVKNEVKEKHPQDFKELIASIFLENEIAAPTDLVWLAQDFCLFVAREIVDKEHTKNAVQEPSSQLQMKEEKNSLNQILYGPPGTGKTYNTIDLAVKIAEPEKFIDGDHSANKKIFEELKENGQVVFTTFHQSMTYEDFIEGIKPIIADEDKSEEIEYEISPGIFKRICRSARTVKTKNISIDWASAKYFKISLGGKRRPDVHQWCIDNNLISLGYSKDNDLKQLMNLPKWEDYRNKYMELFPELAAESRFNIQASYFFQHFIEEGDIVIATKGNHVIDAIGQVEGKYYFDDSAEIDYNHFKKVRWITTDMKSSPEKFFRKRISMQTVYKFADKDVKVDSFEEITSSEKESKPYVLIIDEINRGNVSQIFGELITLIEDDKRDGEENSISVKLPYSKEENFTVPPNLHIIGTMNTADRSVEALDTALRRRFTFMEMMPNSKVVADLLGSNDEWKGMRISKILKTINERIEVLVDRDHLIGHSYFLKLKEAQNFEKELKRVFKDKIIPLLQEYFYNDYVKIGMVLGEGFVKEKQDQNVEFAKIDGTLSTDYEDRRVYEIVSAEELDLEKALRQLMNMKDND